MGKSRVLSRTALLVIPWLTGCATQSLNEENQGPGIELPVLSSPQTNSLARRILENTPEHLHWAPGTKFEWVLVEPNEVAAPRHIRDEVIRQLKRRYTVYQSQDDIPASLKRTRDGDLVGYSDGFRFSYKAEFEGIGSVCIEYHDWEGLLAASRHTVSYRWNGWDWIVLHSGPMTVS